MCNSMHVCMEWACVHACERTWVCFGLVLTDKEWAWPWLLQAAVMPQQHQVSPVLLQAAVLLQPHAVAGHAGWAVVNVAEAGGARWAVAVR